MVMKALHLVRPVMGVIPDVASPERQVRVERMSREKERKAEKKSMIVFLDMVCCSVAHSFMFPIRSLRFVTSWYGPL